MYGMHLAIFGIFLWVLAVGLFVALIFYAKKSEQAWEERQIKAYGRVCVEEGKLLSGRQQAKRTSRAAGKEAVT